MAEKEVPTKELELTNDGVADRIIIGADKLPVRIAPGASGKVVVVEKVAAKLKAASEAGDTLVLGGSRRKQEEPAAPGPERERLE